VTLRPAAPAYVQFFPTLRCNESCDFCFNRGLAPLPDVEPAEFARMLDRLLAAGVDTLDLLGGEPTLHPRPPLLDGSFQFRHSFGVPPLPPVSFFDDSNDFLGSIQPASSIPCPTFPCLQATV
jgi:hypothetical protein